ncbi:MULTISPECIES: nucleotidyltransferase family protein [unclassified Agarivorans]|uniref:nucleotidyltransferase family protein n=1 Tax=unclassified Agarivorans TaxID=2636026 RepID=UPI003D7D48AA
METIIQLLQNDRQRLQALDCVHRLGLPQGYLAAGFVRNMVWDHLHHKPVATPLNDVDVIYFDAEETDPERQLKLEAKLRSYMPQLHWQVRNQARMHLRNHDRPYLSTLDAMSFWPEKETAVAIRKTSQGYECVSAFGFESLFQLNITHNPKRSREVFEQRIQAKAWLAQWPKLTIEG